MRALGHPPGLFIADRKTVLIAAGGEGDTRRRAHRGIRIGLQKPRAAQGEPVDVRRLVVTAAITGQVAIAKVIGHDETILGRRCWAMAIKGAAARAAPRRRASRRLMFITVHLKSLKQFSNSNSGIAVRGA